MKQSPHNPDYRLISVTLNNKEFVYAEQNYTGGNPGLEIYYYAPEADHFHYSRRFKPNTVPAIYQLLFRKLKQCTSMCRPGHKLELSLSGYQSI